MPTHREIRAKIAEKIFALDNAVAVHEYERYTRNMSDLVAMYKSGDADNPRLHGWYVRLVATKEVFVNVSRWSIWHTWRMRGFMALDDADQTELLFDDAIEAIRDDFREDMDLGGLVAECVAENGESGVQMISSGPVMFAGVLCHSAELGLTTQHLQ